MCSGDGNHWIKELIFMSRIGGTQDGKKKNGSKESLISELLEGIHFLPHPPQSCSKTDTSLFKTFSPKQFI